MKMCSTMMPCSSSSSIPTSKVIMLCPDLMNMLRNYTQRHDLVFLQGNHSESQELVYVIHTCANRGSDLKVC